MRNCFVLGMCLLLSSYLLGQNLLLETYGGFNRTNYKDEERSGNQDFYTYGARVAGGLAHIQIGAELERSLTGAEFNLQEGNRREIYRSDYAGAFLRVKLSSLPAHRFGLVLKAGAGFYDTEVELQFPDNPSLNIQGSYPEKALGYHFGIGISSPLYRTILWSLTYQFNGLKRESLDLGGTPLPAYDANHHSLQLGLSVNLVFGEARRRADEWLAPRKKR